MSKHIFNANDPVKVKLAETGNVAVERLKKEISRRYPHIEGEVNKMYIEDDEEYTEFVLHDFMYIFGNYLHTNPFEFNILIDDKYLKKEESNNE